MPLSSSASMLTVHSLPSNLTESWANLPQIAGCWPVSFAARHLYHACKATGEPVLMICCCRGALGGYVCAARTLLPRSRPGRSRRIAAPEGGVTTPADDDREVVARAVAPASIPLKVESLGQRTAAAWNLGTHTEQRSRRSPRKGKHFEQRTVHVSPDARSGTGANWPGAH